VLPTVVTRRAGAHGGAEPRTATRGPRERALGWARDWSPSRSLLPPNVLASGRLVMRCRRPRPVMPVSALESSSVKALDCFAVDTSRRRVGWPGALQPPAPSDPGVTVSRHRALLIGQ
jgi:hypothetical protein